MNKIIPSLSTKLSNIESSINSGFTNVKMSITSLKSNISGIPDLIIKSRSDTVSFLIAALILVVITLIFAAIAAFKAFKG